MQIRVRIGKLRNAADGYVEAAAKQLLGKIGLAAVTADYGNFLKHSIPSFRVILC